MLVQSSSTFFFCAVKGHHTVSLVWMFCFVHCPCQQEEMKAQLPRYQRLAPRPGQAHVAAPPVAAVGGIMPPQQGLPPQQPGMRHPMHGEKMLVCVQNLFSSLFKSKPTWWFYQLMVLVSVDNWLFSKIWSCCFKNSHSQDGRFLRCS